MARTMPSSLEIAQAARLRPIHDVAEETGLRRDEYEPYGRYKAKIDLGVLERLRADPAEAERVRRRAHERATRAFVRSQREWRAFLLAVARQPR